MALETWAIITISVVSVILGLMLLCCLYCLLKPFCMCCKCIGRIICCPFKMCCKCVKGSGNCIDKAVFGDDEEDDKKSDKSDKSSKSGKKVAADDFVEQV
eukprot:Lankesteria_metandrocarpae@DN6043_c0_g1_i1.p1